MKLCLKCKEWKDLNKFYKDTRRKDQRYSHCKVCVNKESMKSYYKDKAQGNCPECGKKNLTNRALCEKCNENYRLSGIKYRKTLKFKEQRNQYSRNKRKTDLQFKLGQILRIRINQALKDNYKSGSAVRDLGCSIPELIVHLESQFVDGMNWQNYGNGKGKWNIDHIIPLSKVDLTDREQFLKVCYYSNLQPLWTLDNIKKGAKCFF